MPWKVSKWFHQKVRSTDGLENICCMIFLHMIHLGNGLGAFLTSTGAKWAHRDPAWLSRWRLSTPKLFPTSPWKLEETLKGNNQLGQWAYMTIRNMNMCKSMHVYIYILIISFSFSLTEPLLILSMEGRWWRFEPWPEVEHTTQSS